MTRYTNKELRREAAQAIKAAKVGATCTGYTLLLDGQHVSLAAHGTRKSDGYTITVNVAI